MKNGKSQAEKDYSGNAGNGVYLNLTVIYDEKATNTVSMQDRIDPNPTSTTTEAQVGDANSPGYTNPEGTSSQVSSQNTKHDSADKSNKDGAGATISHELGHQLGLSDTSKAQRDKDSRAEKGNKMDSPARTPASREITPEQRALIIQLTPEAQ